jgi:parallel beta-helix repeat protein
MILNLVHVVHKGESRVKKLLIVFILLFFTFTQLFGATYYLRTDGTAANKGAAGGPCSTVSAAMNESVHNGETFASSDIITTCDDGGKYFSTIIPPTDGVIYQGNDPNEEMMGVELVTGWTLDTGDTYYKSWTSGDPNIFIADEVMRAEAADVPSLAAEEWFYDSGTPRIYFKTDGVQAIGDYTLEVPNVDYIFNINGIDNITIKDIHFEGAELYAIFAQNGTTGLIIEDNTIKNFYGRSIDVVSDDAAETVDVIIRNNTFIDAGSGIEVYIHPLAAATSTALIEGNNFSSSFYDGTADKIPSSDSMMAVKLLNVDTATIARNVVVFPPVTGAGNIITLWTDFTNDPLIEQNTITGGNHGILISSATSGGIMRYNTVIGSYDDCFWVWVVTDSRVYGNFCNGSGDDGFDIRAATDPIIYDNTSARNVDVGFAFRGTGSGGIMRNNISYENGQPGTPQTGDDGGFEVWVESTSTSGFDAEYNLYYHTTAKQTSTPFSWSGTGYSFADWQTAPSDQDDSSQTPADPLFVDITNNDGHLLPGSPAIDMGTILSNTYAYDNDGHNQNSYGSAWELGAYVYRAESRFGGE